MDALYKRTLNLMGLWLIRTEKLVPKPIEVAFQNSLVFRYEEKSIKQALVQKLARMVTALHSARLLVNNGLLQDQGSIQRMLDEFQDDIAFMAYGLIENDLTNLHDRYLKAFYEEEFDAPDSAIDSTQKRESIPRKKIRAYIANKEASIAKRASLAANPSRDIETNRSLSKAYSGFLHGASPQIMELYGGTPLKFQVSGMLGTQLEISHKEDLWNYFFRGLNCFHLVALAFGDPGLNEEIGEYRLEFDQASG